MVYILRDEGCGLAFTALWRDLGGEMIGAERTGCGLVGFPTGRLGLSGCVVVRAKRRLATEDVQMMKMDCGTWALEEGFMTL